MADFSGKFIGGALSTGIGYGIDKKLYNEEGTLFTRWAGNYKPVLNYAGNITGELVESSISNNLKDRLNNLSLSSQPVSPLGMNAR